MRREVGGMIGFDEAVEGTRRKAEGAIALQHPLCALRAGTGAVSECTTSGVCDIDGPHFRRICSACGAQWHECARVPLLQLEQRRDALQAPAAAGTKSRSASATLWRSVLSRSAKSRRAELPSVGGNGRVSRLATWRPSAGGRQPRW